MKWGLFVELVVCWMSVFVYVWCGGVILRDLEVQAGIQAASDYCVKVDMLMRYALIQAANSLTMP